MTTPKFCPSCGNQNEMQAGFCYSCGSSLPALPPVPDEPMSKKKKNAAYAVVAMCFVFFGLFIFAVLLIEAQKPKRNAHIVSATPASSPSSRKAIDTPSAPSIEARQSEEFANARRHVEEFNTALSAPAIKAYMANAKLSDLSPDDLEVTVTTRWHYEPKAIRLQMAQVIWKAWAGIHRPEKPDAAYITLRDASGNKVGGSRVMGGSLIWVSD